MIFLGLNSNLLLKNILKDINFDLSEIQRYDQEKTDEIMRKYTNQINEVNTLKDEIIEASKSTKGAFSHANSGSASSGLIAGILLDEIIRRDGNDNTQDSELQKLVKQGTAINSKTEIQAVSIIPIHKNILSVSFGKAQMQLGLVVELVENGYLQKPKDWSESTKYNIAAKWLLDDSKAPELIAARIENIYEWWKYSEVRTKYGNINIEEPVYPDLSNSPGVFGTLYSIGLYTQNNKGEEEPKSSFERGEGIARYGRIFKNNYGLK
ncbi:MAG TPA: hypothetical protein DCM02_13690 [Flavobacterium sp.]|nr:hypothetical protein [Flavobacterium sp.]